MGDENNNNVLVNPFGTNNTRVAIPQNLNGGIIRIRIYYSGGTGGINTAALAGEDAFFDTNRQNILITQDHYLNGQQLGENFYNDLLEKLKKQGYNVEGFKVDTYSGVSSGSAKAAARFKAAFRDENEKGPLYLNLYDPVLDGSNIQLPFNPQQRVNRDPNSPTLLDKMQQTHSCFRLITTDKNYKIFIKDSNLNKLAEAGINTIVISGKTYGKDDNNIYYHETTYPTAVRCGWEDYFNGTIELKDIANSVKDNNGTSYDLNFTITIPEYKRDENGNLVYEWKKPIPLEDLKNQSFNFLSYDIDKMKEIEETFKYLEGCRVKTDYDALAEVEELRSSTNDMQAASNLTSIKIDGVSELLPTENVMISSVAKKAGTFAQSISSTASNVVQAIDSYKKTEEDLNNDTSNV